MIRKRKIPLRICIGCQERKPKKELIRIVRTPHGDVELDLTGKKPGRGAYLCLSQVCLKRAIKGKRLEKNLQIPVSTVLIDQISVMLEKNIEDERY